MLTRTEELFFELLRIALGTQESLTATLTDDEWLAVSQMAVKQSVLGILYSAVEKLPEVQCPPTDLYIDMYQCVQEIEDRNRHLNKMTALVSSRFRKDGFPNCILKGQGIALLYPNPLRRQSGDIDIWLKGERKDIIKYVQKIVPSKKPNYHHIGFNLKDGTMVEAHFTPSLAFNPLTNWKIQKWAKMHQDDQMKTLVVLPDSDREITIPTLRFNAVFILHHLFKHLLYEGVAMRHVLDYYYVLRAFHAENPSALVLDNVEKDLTNLNLKKISGALGWIYVHLLGLPMDCLLLPPNEKDGKFIVRQILDNAGQTVEENSRFHQRLHFVRPYLTSYFSEAVFFPLQGVLSSVRKWKEKSLALV